MAVDLPLGHPFYIEAGKFRPRFCFKSSPKAPAAPDPKETAAAQTATNKETAYWNAVLNNVNQITPYGNLTYAQTGGGKQYNMDAYNKALAAWNSQPLTTSQTSNGVNSYQGGGGSSSVTVDRGPAPKLEDFLIGDSPPQFTSTITLSPEQQKIYDTQTQQEQYLLDLGGEQLQRIRDSVSTPYSFSGIPSLYGEGDLNAARTATEDAIYSRLNPQFARDEEALRTRLANQGIFAGSEAYGTELDRFNQMKNDARMQAVLAGGDEAQRLFNQSLAARQQGITEYNTQRNAPLNEYIGLTSGTQVQNPQFNNTNMGGAAPVDYANLVNQNYQNQMAQYNANVAGRNSTTNALFGLGGSFLGGVGQAGGLSKFFAMSDIRMKENINKIGETPAGIGVYEFNFIGDDTLQVGVMAQEVEKVIPEAVIEIHGIKRVNYAMVR